MDFTMWLTASVVGIAIGALKAAGIAAGAVWGVRLGMRGWKLNW